MTDFETFQKVKEHVSAISSLLGIEVTESNFETPDRVAKMYCTELFENRNGRNLDKLKESMKLFKYNRRGMCPSPIVIRDIPFWSVCEHHWLPFGGKCTVEYYPSEYIIGLSKIPRVVKYFSKMPQLQERLTEDIGEFLKDLLNPVMIKVTIVAEHTCVVCRGVETPCSTRTEYYYENPLYI